MSETDRDFQLLSCEHRVKGAPVHFYLLPLLGVILYDVLYAGAGFTTYFLILTFLIASLVQRFVKKKAGVFAIRIEKQRLRIFEHQAKTWEKFLNDITRYEIKPAKFWWGYETEPAYLFLYTATDSYSLLWSESVWPQQETEQFLAILDNPDSACN